MTASEPVSANSEKISQVSHEVLMYSHDSLMVSLRFLDAPLSRLPLTEGLLRNASFATDGNSLIYDPRMLLISYREEKTRVTRDYLHAVLHCVFGHIFVPEDTDPAIWHLSCDIAVEYAIAGLNQAGCDCVRQQRQMKIFEKLESTVGLLTAEKICRFYIKNPPDPDDFEQIASFFYADSHHMWTSSPEGSPERLKWLTVSRRVQIDMETFTRRQAGKAGALMTNLKSVNRELSDYASFLSAFAVKGDGMKLDPDEFDLVTYSYGMQTSGGKVPLIEPTEYKDSMRIRDFVLAIETAALDPVKIASFVKQTWDVLSSTETFFSKVRLHILDGKESLITNDDELAAYLEAFNGPVDDLIVNGEDGLKKVDSRAVFNRVNELKRRRAFKNLRGLFVFTDCDVVFPATMPAFKAAFIYAKDDYSTPAVPAWGMRLILEPEDL